MAVQSSFYTPDGTTRTFPSTKHIATKQHMAVWYRRISDNLWEIQSVSKYELINNTVVLVEAPDALVYGSIEIRVADTFDELTASPSDIATVSSISADITDVNAISDEVVTVSGLAAEVADIGAEPLRTAVLNGATNATSAATSASNAATSESNAAISESNAAISESNAATSESDAVVSATASQLSAWESAAEYLTAQSYAIEAEDVLVKSYTSNGDGTFTAADTTDYSVLHYSAKSSTSATASSDSATLSEQSYQNALALYGSTAAVDAAVAAAQAAAVSTAADVVSTHADVVLADAAAAAAANSALVLDTFEVQSQDYTFTAAGGETTLELLDDDGYLLDLNEKSVELYKNGVKQKLPTNSTLNGGTTLSLPAAAVLGEVYTVGTSDLDRNMSDADIEYKMNLISNFGSTKSRALRDESRPYRHALANASNHVYLDGLTQSVPLDIVHTLGADRFSTIEAPNANVTVSAITNGYNAAFTVDGTSVLNSLRFNVTDTDFSTPNKLTFTATINSGTLVFDRYYNGTVYAPLEYEYTIIDGVNTLELPITTATNFYLVAKSISTPVNVDLTFITIVSIEDITLPAASYLTKFSPVSKTWVEMSSTGDRGTVLPVSTTYSQTASFSHAFSHTSPLTDAEVAQLTANPDLIWQVWFNSYVLVDGFAKADIVDYWPAVDAESGKYIQNVGVALGNTLFEGIVISDASTTGALIVNNGGDNYTLSANFGSGGGQYPRTQAATNTLIGTEIDKYYILSFDYDVTLNSIPENGVRLYQVYFSGKASVVNKVLSGKGTFYLILKATLTSTSVVSSYLYWGDNTSAFSVNISNYAIREASASEIANYTSNCRTNYLNTSYGASNLSVIQDGSGRPTAISPTGTTQWREDGRNATTGWTITAPFTVYEELDGVKYVWTSDGNKYVAGVASGTYTLPTGIWTMADNLASDNTTTVAARGNVKLFERVLTPTEITAL